MAALGYRAVTDGMAARSDTATKAYCAKCRHTHLVQQQVLDAQQHARAAALRLELQQA